MKIKISADKLRDTLAISTRAIGGKAAMPILDCAHIDASRADDRVFITCTNLDMHITASCPAEVKEKGAICISGKRFQGIVAESPVLDAAITTDARNRLDFKAGSSHFKLMGIGPEEWPKFRVPVDAKVVTMEQTQLLALVNSVSDAQSDDPTRYALNATYIERKEGVMSFVATDSRRMHMNTVKDVDGAQSGIIIPSRAVAVLTSLLGEKGTVEISYDPKSILFVIQHDDGVIELQSKLVEASYPNWRQVLPKPDTQAAAITIDREDFIDVVKRVRMVLDEKHTSIRVTVDGMGLTIEGSSPNNGEATELLMCKNPGGIKGAFALNPLFLLESLTSVETKEVELRLNAAQMDVSAICLHAGDARSVIMPVRLT